MSFAGDVGTLLSKIQQQQESNAQMLSQIRADAKALTEAARRVEASSSGSNFGYHSELYYRDFETPPAGHRFNVEWGCVNGPQPGWGSKTPEQVKERIEHISEREFEKVEHDSAQLVDSSKQLLDEILIALAPLHSTTGLTKACCKTDALNSPAIVAEFLWEVLFFRLLAWPAALQLVIKS